MRILPALILALASRHTPVLEADEYRLQAVAQEIWEAAGEVQAFCGTAAREATSLALASIAEHESGWDERVQDCRRTGGQAISLYQLEQPAWAGHRRADICADNELAARLAATALARGKGRADVRELFGSYASGGTPPRNRAGDEIASLYASLSARAGVVTRYKDGCLTAERRTR
jgi:protein tyrosine phosphatase (PTP) superfamily phosphohydrolase (DUF442 family)